MYKHHWLIQRFENTCIYMHSCRLPDSASRGVVFPLRISPQIRSQNRNGSKFSVRDLCGTDLCKNPRKSASLPCPFKWSVPCLPSSFLRPLTPINCPTCSWHFLMAGHELVVYLYVWLTKIHFHFSTINNRNLVHHPAHALLFCKFKGETGHKRIYIT
jgi:hypothetical protein